MPPIISAAEAATVFLTIVFIDFLPNEIDRILFNILTVALITSELNSKILKPYYLTRT